MPIIRVILEGDGAWPDLKGEQGVVHLAEGAMQIACLSGGMKSGRPSLAIRLDLPTTEADLVEEAISEFMANVPSDPSQEEREWSSQDMAKHVSQRLAHVVIAETSVRAFLVAADAIKDLPPLEPRVVLRNGPIPGFLFKLALDAMLAHPTLELYAAVVYEGGEYHLRVPSQVRSEGGLRDIQLPPNRVLDLHSHANMSAFFSGTDNHDEQGFQLYAVVGKLLEGPEVRLRVGLYGHFQAVRWADVFTGPPLAMDVNDEREEER